MRFTRPVMALSIGALSVLAISAALLAGSNSTAVAQTPNCAAPPPNAITERCLVIVKQTIPNGATQAFGFDYAIDAPDAPVVNGSDSLQDGQAFGLPLGAQGTPSGTVIVITETVPNGWTLADVDCNGAGITVSLVAGGIQVTYTGNLGNEPFAYGVCTFINRQDATSTPTITPTGTTTTPTATGTVSTSTPTATATPNYYQNPNNPPPGGLGGLFAPNPQPTRTAVPQQSAPSAPSSTVRPPSTGDAGLR